MESENKSTGVWFYDGAGYSESILAYNLEEDRFAMAFLDADNSIRQTARQVSFNYIPYVVRRCTKQTDNCVIIFPQRIFDITYAQIAAEKNQRGAL